MTEALALSREALRLQRPVLLAARLSAILALRHQRARLGGLDADRLADLGLSRDQALAEARRPFWDVPDSWRS